MRVALESRSVGLDRVDVCCPCRSCSGLHPPLLCPRLRESGKEVVDPFSKRSAIESFSSRVVVLCMCVCLSGLWCHIVKY